MRELATAPVVSARSRSRPAASRSLQRLNWVSPSVSPLVFPGTPPTLRRLYAAAPPPLAARTEEDAPT
jgi:hypothetical protein